ncbi:hypothetical protein [Actinomadura monticuli]|uniref:Uncharacterized protein n=1 Tax=Actinomadura monticuli TaxID=3097367 RepID=A0ABV4Q710_9ACTN
MPPVPRAAERSPRTAAAGTAAAPSRPSAPTWAARPPWDDARSLVRHALDAGTRDNTTALLIRVAGLTPG